jgi:hypothetical protein
MQEMFLSDALASKFEDGVINIVLFSLSSCEPCEIALDALSSLEIDGMDNVRRVIVKIEREDKREVGKAVMNGISSFPRIDVLDGRNLLSSVVGVGPAETAEMLKERIRNIIADRSSSTALASA